MPKVIEDISGIIASKLVRLGGNKNDRRSKKDYRIKTNEILKELEPVLFDGEVMNYSERISGRTK